MDLGLGGKTALVAGASSGIGYAAAEALAREGAQVVIASRSAERIEAAAERMRAATRGAVHPIPLDVRDPDAGDRLVDAALEQFGPPAILVTNAGGPFGRNFLELPIQAYEDALQLSFLSAVRLTRAAVPHMQRAGWGRVLHVSSGTVWEPNPDLFMSSTVRPALAGFSKALAAELAPHGITVNLVCPGYIRTESLEELAERRARDAGTSVEAAFEAMAETIPMGRIGTPEELADVMCFLCSERAGYVTGHAVRVDGGKVAFLL